MERGGKGVVNRIYAYLTCLKKQLCLVSEADSSQRLSKLLEGKGRGKSKQASLSSQHQAASAAITPAMRQHATTRISQALRDNSALSYKRPQAAEEEEEDEEAGAEAAAFRWESGIYQGSSSKSAYLSKLANAVAQIKRASDLAQLDIPTAASEHTQARQLGNTAQDVLQTRTQSSQGAGILDKTQQQRNQEADAGTPAQPASAPQPVSENELQRLMHLLSGKT